MSASAQAVDQDQRAHARRPDTERRELEGISALDGGLERAKRRLGLGDREDAVGDQEPCAMSLGEPIEQWVPAVALATHQLQGARHPVAEQVRGPIACDRRHRFGPLGDGPIGGRAGELHERHGAGVQGFALARPFRGDRLGQCRARQRQRSPPGAPEHAAIEGDAEARFVRLDGDFLVEALHGPSPTGAAGRPSRR
jgi:hypothetical protein